MLKPAGTKHLKLKCDESLSSFAFKFNLRRYSVVDFTQDGGAVQVDNIKTRFESVPGFSA
jgi:hypothetical protein